MQLNIVLQLGNTNQKQEKTLKIDFAEWTHLGGLGEIAAGWKFADWAGLCMEFWVILYGCTIGCCMTSVQRMKRKHLFMNINMKLDFVIVCFSRHNVQQARISILCSLKMPGFLASMVCSSTGASPSGSSLPRLSFSSLKTHKEVHSQSKTLTGQRTF